jgi:hypothetical protein
MPQTPDIPREITSLQVLGRFFWRVVILFILAAAGRHGFEKTFASLLMLAAIYCGFTAAFRREPLFGPSLTHFDEAAAFAVIAYLISRFV